MTGPEHYAEAELQIEVAARELEDGEPKAAELSLGFAQVHATLALAAATALGTEQYGPDSTAWHGAAATTHTKPVRAAGDER
jgi:hypothetical protein